jgi:hypothetical protein
MGDSGMEPMNPDRLEKGDSFPPLRYLWRYVTIMHTVLEKEWRIEFSGFTAQIGEEKATGKNVLNLDTQKNGNKRDIYKPIGAQATSVPVMPIKVRPQIATLTSRKIKGT